MFTPRSPSDEPAPVPDPTKDSFNPDEEEERAACSLEAPRPGMWNLMTAHHKRNLMIIAAAAIIGIPAGTYAGNLAYKATHPRQVSVSGQQAPIEPQAPVVPPTLTKIRTAFGPWQLVDSGRSVSFHLLLISQTGNLEASAMLHYTDDSWKPAVAPQVEAIRLNGDVAQLRLSPNRVIDVAVWQILIFEGAPDMAYAVTTDGTLIGKPTAEILKGK